MSELPPPTYARRTLLAAADMLKSLGHSGLSRFLLELGIENDGVGRGNGLMERANSLAKFAIDNPALRSPEGRTIPSEMIQRASELWHSGQGQPNERDNFAAAMHQEGQPLTPYAVPSAALLNTPEADTSFTSKLRRAVEEQKMNQASTVLPKRIFIVHGHDEGTRETVARFVETLGFKAVILHEQPNKGRTIITKFREEAADIGFAIVLMTPDDHGGKAGGESRPRARQNVVFELGFFIGALGPEKVAALVKGEVEKPSDFHGVVYIPLDQGEWRISLAKELKAAGFEVDLNRVIGA
jgi:predicted nucleotide-binding protein